MNHGIYNERLLTKEEQAKKTASEYVVREEIQDSMCIVFVLDDGHEIRVSNDADHITVNVATGSLNIRPESSNSARMEAVIFGSD